MGQGVEKANAVCTNLTDKGIALGTGLRQAHVFDPHVVALVPLGRRKRVQPVRRDLGNVVERRTQRFGHGLHAVENANGREPVRAVGALPSACFEQSILTRGVQHPRQQAAHRVVVQQPAAELAQRAALKARVDEVKRKQACSVDPGTNGFCRLPVAQPFAERQQRHPCKSPRRRGRLPALGTKVGDVRIREHGAEPVAQDQAGIASVDRSAGNAGGVVGHGRDRPLWAK